MHLAAVIVHIHERRVAVIRCKAVELIGQRQRALLRIGSRHGQIAERDLVLSHRAAGTRCTGARAIMHQHADSQNHPKQQNQSEKPPCPDVYNFALLFL